MDNNSILKTLIGEGKDDTINSVGILVFYRNKMLTTQRKSGTWSIPKGRIKEGEEPLLAISREVVEELGFALPKIPRKIKVCLLYTSPSPRDVEESRMPSSA